MIKRIAVLAGFLAGAAPGAALAASSHWAKCDAVTAAYVQQNLKGFYNEQRAVAAALKDRGAVSVAVAKIACYEASFNTHAQDGRYLGLFQIDEPKIDRYGIGMARYWNGDRAHSAMFYQIMTGMRYIQERYDGSPDEAWAHEANYGWY